MKTAFKRYDSITFGLADGAEILANDFVAAILSLNAGVLEEYGIGEA